MRLSCALLCFFCEKSWSICELPALSSVFRYICYIKYQFLSNTGLSKTGSMDNRPGVLSLFTFSIDPVFFFSHRLFPGRFISFIFLSFHPTSQKSGCRRCQLHLRPSKRLLCLPAEENHRPDRISLAQNRHNYLGAALLHLIRGNRDKCFFSPRRTDILTFGDCQLQRPADRLLVIFLLWSPDTAMI